MKYEEFVAAVRERVAFENPDRAEEATDATLDVLGERLAGGEPSNLAAQLPDALAQRFRGHDGDAGTFGVEEFYQRIGDRIGVTPGKAREYATGVMSTVVDLVTHGETTDLAAQLPADYAELLR